MSQTLQENQQEQETSSAHKNRKRRNRVKRAGGCIAPAKCESGELLAAASDIKLVSDKRPLHTSMEQLGIGLKPATPIASRKGAGSNWEAVAKVNQQGKVKTSDQENVATKGDENHLQEAILTKSARKRQKRRAAQNNYIALDCEMVGVGPNGKDDIVARVSLVSKRGIVLLDKFVKPQQPVTDYRTSISGIRPHDINNGEDFDSVQEEVVQMLQGKILVGHALDKDLGVLHIKHPRSNIRDTSHYKPLRRIVANGRTPSLKRLTQAILGREIQTGEHNSVEDARAAMSIYNTLASDWEAYIKRHQPKFGK